MKLIDADELKKYAIPCEIHNGALTDLCVPLYQIDNAPTVGHNQLTQDIIDKVNVNVGLAQPINEERPQGDWLDIYSTHIAYECSNCHIQMPITDYFNFCPNCGARMKVKKNER